MADAQKSVNAHVLDPRQNVLLNVEPMAVVFINISLQLLKAQSVTLLMSAIVFLIFNL
jgi:hypothetical protein